MEKDRLYLSLKNKICEKIFQGLYKEGVNIPPERMLAESFGVSRVTVRKALDLLERDGIVERVQGSGTIVKLKETGFEGTMDIIALLAPAQNPFFSSFIDYFQKNAEKNDSLVLFKQNPQDERVEDTLFKLFKKDIRNVVIWLEDLKLESDYIRRLRGLGMNMVFFDIAVPTPYADCVSLDNHDAVKALYNYLGRRGAKTIGYIGWDNFFLSSVREREDTFTGLNTRGGTIYHIPWAERRNLPQFIEEFAVHLNRDSSRPDGIICGDGEIGIALKKILSVQGINNMLIVSIDDYPEAESLSMSVYMQSFDILAQRAYQCLLEQNLNAGQWRASVYPIKGRLIER